MNLREAVGRWVNGFSAIPSALIEKAYGGDNIDDMQEVTPLVVGDLAWSNDLQTQVEIIGLNKEEGTALIADHDAEVDLDDLYPERDSWLPMWGTLWTFGDSADEWWIEQHLQEMADCGFRIFESDELGYFFGIDGAGYDFYTAHWIPLYKTRGLRWHSEKEIA